LNLTSSTLTVCVWFKTKVDVRKIAKTIKTTIIRTTISTGDKICSTFTEKQRESEE
jgi:hypothetical protein